MKKLFIIADTHGRSNWKDKADIEHLIKLPNLATEYDKYIFLGDYTDSFEETNAVILHNLKEIIQFKKNYPEHVVLLLGNHDLQYYFQFNGYGCTGYRLEAYQELHKLFTDNKDLFQVIFQAGTYLFTHAGITSVWWKKFVKELFGIEKTEYSPYYLISEEFKKNDPSPTLFDVGRGGSRGGYNKSGGPFWADKSESSIWLLPNYHQIVGHNEVPRKTTVENEKESITYVDNGATGTMEIIVE